MAAIAAVVSVMSGCHHNAASTPATPVAQKKVTAHIEVMAKNAADLLEAHSASPGEGTGGQAGIQKAPGTPAPKPSLGDYVPCRFTDLAEGWLRQGYTPPQDGIAAAADGSVAGGQSNARPGTEAQDVGCSQSVLTWDETRWIFGRKIADTYIAFQVTARNTNTDEEFLIHDLQVAVASLPATGAGQASATAPDGSACTVPEPAAEPASYTHFMTGRDKIMVRGVGQTGQAFTKRNIAEHVLEAVGGILGATAAVAGTSEFSSAVHIFGAAGVPGFNKVFPDLNMDQIDRLNDLGFSANSAYKIVIPKNGSVPMTTFLPSDVFATNYKHWTKCQLLRFANSAIVVMGGKHIQEVSDQASVKELKCPIKDNYLDLSKATGGNVQCEITGTDLQLLTAVRLKNDADANDQTTLDGTPSLTGSTTSGNVTFSEQKLSALPASRYQAYAEGARGETATTTRLDLPPTASAATTQIARDGSTGCDNTSKDCVVKLSGNRLDQVTGVQLLRTSDGSRAADGTWSATGTTSGSATFALSAISNLQNGDYVVGLVTSKGTVPSAAKVTLTGK